ncbi:MAG: imidazole glycerol phosphate synthase subunit HisH [bacterium]
MVVIVDYGMGNLRSVHKAVVAIGSSAIISNKPDDIIKADKLIIPGVGAFGDGMQNIRDYGIEDAIVQFINSGKPVLGICLGMQMLFYDGDENPGIKGLSVIKGSVKMFDQQILRKQGLKIPHIGWNAVTQTRKSFLFEGIPDKSYFYFVHSYYPVPAEDVGIGVTDYGVDFTSVIQKGNIVATQFHPEKSQKMGLRLLSNFINYKG